MKKKTGFTGISAAEVVCDSKSHCSQEDIQDRECLQYFLLFVGKDLNIL